MRLVSIYDYFKDKEGQQLVVRDKEILLLGVHYHEASDKVALNFDYNSCRLRVQITKPQADLSLAFSKQITGLQKETFTPIDKLDSTLLIYLGKFAEEMEEKVEYKLFDWRG